MPQAVDLIQKIAPAHAKRLAWAMKEHGQSVQVALERDRSATAATLCGIEGTARIEATIRLIMERADPTSNKRFTAWLVREYAEGRLILEDLGAANETLTLFLRYAPRLGPEQRDIQRYGSLAAAWEAVRDFAERDEVQSNRAQRALDRAKAYAESRILRQDPDGFTVAVPLTVFAARWWGRGTRWCTAAKQDNAFYLYQQRAPLVVLVIPEAGKFQFWCTQQEFQLRDAADSHVSPDYIEQYWSIFAPLFEFALKQRNENALLSMPKRIWDEERLIETLALIPNAARIFARMGFTSSLYANIIKKLSDVGTASALFSHIPRKTLTPELIAAAVTRNGQNLAFVPREYRTHFLFKTALESKLTSLKMVPPSMLTEEVCWAAVERDAGAFRSVPISLRSERVCLAAVRANGSLLRLVPKEKRTEAICAAALAVDGEAIHDVPRAILNAKLCEIAIRNNPRMIAHLRRSPFMTEELARIAVEEEGAVLALLPEKMRTVEICRIAIEKHGIALKSSPRELGGEEFGDILWCEKIIEKNPHSLELIPERLRTERLYERALRQAGRFLEKVPPNHLSVHLIELALKNDPEAIKFVPAQFLSEPLCLKSVERNGFTLALLPQRWRTEKICLAALKANPNAIDFVPQGLKSREFFITALLQRDSMALRSSVPDGMFQEVLRAVESRARPRVPSTWVSGVLSDLETLFSTDRGGRWAPPEAPASNRALGR